MQKFVSGENLLEMEVKRIWRKDAHLHDTCNLVVQKTQEIERDGESAG